MNGRTATRVALALVLVLAAVGIGVFAYNAGYADGIASTGSAVAGRVYPFYGPFGYHWGGFGFLGLLFPLLFFFLVLFIVRAAFWGGRPRRYGPWYGDPGRGPDSDFEAWHRRAHGDGPDSQGGAGSAPPRNT